MVMAVLYPYSAFSPYFVHDASVVIPPGIHFPGTVIFEFTDGAGYIVLEEEKLVLD